MHHNDSMVIHKKYHKSHDAECLNNRCAHRDTKFSSGVAKSILWFQVSESQINISLEELEGGLIWNIGQYPLWDVNTLSY